MKKKQLNKVKYGRETDKQLKAANKAIRKIIETDRHDLTDINHDLYAAESLIAG